MPDFEGRSPRGIYGDVVSELDWSVGEILKTLQALGLDKNTLVIFTSDNGPWLLHKDHGGSAGLLRNGKSSAFEGGTRVPMIARWPDRIKPNLSNDEIVSALDLFPTIANLTGTPVDKNLVLDGVDQSGVLLHGAHSRRDEVFYYANADLYAVRKGSWKAHFITKENPYSREEAQKLNTPLLYNLNVDPGEKYDVAGLHADVVVELTALYYRQLEAITLSDSEIDKILMP